MTTMMATSRRVAKGCQGLGLANADASRVPMAPIELAQHGSDLAQNLRTAAKKVRN